MPRSEYGKKTTYEKLTPERGAYAQATDHGATVASRSMSATQMAGYSPYRPETDLSQTETEETTTLDFESESTKLAETLLGFKEKGLREQLSQMEQAKAYGGLAIEEAQSKFGISGGLALVQQQQQEAQMTAQMQPILGEISMLPYEQEILQRDIFKELQQEYQEQEIFETEQERQQWEFDLMQRYQEDIMKAELAGLAGTSGVLGAAATQREDE